MAGVRRIEVEVEGARRLVKVGSTNGFNSGPHLFCLLNIGFGWYLSLLNFAS